MAITTVTTGSPARGILKYSKTFDQLTAPGSTDHINIPGARFHTFQVTLANKDTNVVISVDGSLDGTNFFTMPVKDFTATGISYTNEVATITADGVYLIYVEDVVVEDIRATFVSEAGGTAATVDIKYLGRS